MGKPKIKLATCDDVEPGDYKQAEYSQFVGDMLDAGLEPYHYRGRCYYEGPAVDVDKVGDAMSKTSVKCSFDGMGLGYVVYPE